MSASASSTQLDPPPFHRFKRWSAIGVVFIILLVGLRWWWGYEANRRYEAMIAAAHARGELITLNDFNNAPAIPDANNAAIPLQAAAKAIKFATTQQSAWFDEYDIYQPIARGDEGMLHAIVTANAASLAQARQARSLPQADYGLRLASPIAGTLLRYLSDAAQLRELQLLGVFDAHLNRDDAEAIELLRDLNRHMNAIAQSQQFLVIHFVSVGGQMATARAAVQLAAELDVAGPSAATTQPASRENLRALIEELLDDRVLRDSARRAFDAERLTVLDTGPGMAATMQPQWLAQLLAPMYLLDSIRAAEYMEPHRRACTQPNYPAAMVLAPLPPDPAHRSGLHMTVDALRGKFMLINRNPQLFQFRALAARREAALALAIRLYKLDHSGQLPSRLDDLVPDYCSAVPSDPFSAAGSGFIYHPHASPPILYSVGINGVDDGGTDGGFDWWDRRPTSGPLDFPIPLSAPK